MSQATFFRPMKARDIEEPHRPATPLELLFDLVSVIAAAAAGLHHAIAQEHALEGVLKFSANLVSDQHSAREILPGDQARTAIAGLALWRLRTRPDA